jgi:hypothetical protein
MAITRKDVYGQETVPTTMSPPPANEPPPPPSGRQATWQQAVNVLRAEAYYMKDRNPIMWAAYVAAADHLSKINPSGTEL